MTDFGERDELDLDVPEADALEQKKPADDDEEETDVRTISIPPDVPEADALDQARDAKLGDEEQ